MLQRKCFPMNFAKYLKSIFFTEQLRMIASESSRLLRLIDESLRKML